MTRDWAIDPIGREAFDKLAELPANRLWSALLELLRRRAVRTPGELIKQYERDAFTAPAPIDQRVAHIIDGHLLAAAAEFEAIELSPVAPLGTCSAIALADQHKILSALRGTEVQADPTNSLALECARRLRAGATGPLRLATCTRVVRCQQVPNIPGFTQHFRIFGLVTAGREAADHGTTTTAIVDHVRTIHRALDRLETAGYAFGKRRVVLRSTAARIAVADRVAAALSDLEIVREELTHPYYDGLRYVIVVTAPNGDGVPLIDGGAVDWVAKLTSNRSYVCVVTGMGAQLIPLRFRA